MLDHIRCNVAVRRLYARREKREQEREDGGGEGGRARSQVLGHVKCVYCRVKGICTQRDSDRKRERV